VWWGRTRGGRTLWIEFQNFGKTPQVRFTSIENLHNFYPSFKKKNTLDITSNSFSSTQIHTQSTGWRKCFEIGITKFQVSHRNSIILYLNAVLSVYISYYVNNTSFLGLPILYEVFIAQCSDECCEHEMNPGIVFIFKLAVTMTLYRATNRLSDADSHYFQIRGHLFHRVCLMSVPLHKNMQIQRLGY